MYYNFMAAQSLQMLGQLSLLPISQDFARYLANCQNPGTRGGLERGFLCELIGDSR